MKAVITALIYRSLAYADSLMEEMQGLPFFFLANNPTAELLDHLGRNGYPFQLRVSPKPSMKDLALLGFQGPDYIADVYAGWNAAVLAAGDDVDAVVLVNSDHKFAPGWFDELRSSWAPDLAMSCGTIERGHEELGSFPGTHVANCGAHPRAFDREKFLREALPLKSRGMSSGGVYMPTMVSRQALLAAGLYPRGNPAPRGYGDRELFARLRRSGVRHVTNWKAMCYHFQQGEMEEPA